MTDTRRPSYLVLFLLLLGMLPALALWAYPGWPELAVGYTPYFNLHAWLGSPLPLWIPPFKAIRLIPLEVPVAYAAAGGFVALGFPSLAALRASAVMALIVGTGGVFTWVWQRWGDWPAMAAALTWLYSPAIGVLSFRLGHLGELWLWAIMAWFFAGLMYWVRRRPLYREIEKEIGQASETWFWLALSWLPLLWPGLDAWTAAPWRKFTLVWGWTALMAAPAVGYLVTLLRRVGPSWLITFVIVVLAARLTLVSTAPRYTQYVPPPWPITMFEANILLLDAHTDLPPAPGRTIHLTLTWQSLQPQDKDWTTFAQVLGPDHRVWGQHDRPTGGDYPTSHWRVGEVVSETYTIAIADDAPRPLHVIVGLYDRATMQRLRALGGRDYVEVRAR